MAVVSMADIANFFEGETKQLKRGENSYSSNRLENFIFDGSTGHMTAKVRASMRDRSYDVQVRFAIDSGRLVLIFRVTYVAALVCRELQ